MPSSTLAPTRPYAAPDDLGHFGPYGGAFIPEILVPAITALKKAYAKTKDDPDFKAEFDALLRDYVGRPTPLTFADRLTGQLGGPKIYLKREDLCHTGAHKVNNTIGQILLARRMGKKRIIAETGAGQHGVATATVCAKFGMECIVYMGAEDIERQNLNVLRMRLLGAEVRPATSGSQTLKDATNEAMRDWVTNPDDTFYIIGSVVGPHPYPMMVRDFHRVIGEETRRQLLEKEAARRPTPSWPAWVAARTRWASFILSSTTRTSGSTGPRRRRGPRWTSRRDAPRRGEPGILHGAMSYLLQDEAGQVQLAHSVSAASTTRASGRSTATSRTRAACSTTPSRTTRRSKASSCSHGRKASSPPSKRPMPWRSCPSSPMR